MISFSKTGQIVPGLQQSILDKLYEASQVGRPDPSLSDWISTQLSSGTISLVDSVLYSVDMSKISFDVALCLLSTVYCVNSELVLYAQFFEQCKMRFKSNFRWSEMSGYSK